jgi:FdhD protein
MMPDHPRSISMPVPDATVTVARVAVHGGVSSDGKRTVPEETAVAFTYNRASYAVMMATPRDLEDFAVGFSLTEGIIVHPSDLVSCEVIAGDLGVELRMELASQSADRFGERRRLLAGPVGCGLCGIESLNEAMRPLPVIRRDARVTSAEISAAVVALGESQVLNHVARALHAAAFWRPGKGLVAVREDVGRHNALDKLAGALASQETSTDEGIVVISSRVSVEMVQKAAMMGAAVVVAISAPTALAIRTAEQANLTLVAVARNDGFEVFSGFDRIISDRGRGH